MTQYKDFFQGNAAFDVCPRCGFTLFEATNDDLAPIALSRPWHLRGPEDVEAYVGSLAEETREWLLALFVDNELNLLSVETIGKGGVGSCPVNFGRLFFRGKAVGATGFVLVHNHPSGDPTPSADDRAVTMRLRRLSAEMDLPLLDHLVVAKGGVGRV